MLCAGFGGGAVAVSEFARLVFVLLAQKVVFGFQPFGLPQFRLAVLFELFDFRSRFARLIRMPRRFGFAPGKRHENKKENSEQDQSDDNGSDFGLQR